MADLQLLSETCKSESILAETKDESKEYPKAVHRWGWFSWVSVGVGGGVSGDGSL